MIENGRVSDHAFLRWLERAKGFDLQTLEREFVALCRPIIESGASGGWIEGDGYKVWLAIKDGNATSTMPTRPQKFRKYIGREQLKQARKSVHHHERFDYDRDTEQA